MNSPMITQINRIADCTDDLPYNDIPSLIKHFSNPDGFIRMQAREILTCIGKPAVPELIKALVNANTQVRREIIKVLESIREPSTIPVLVEQLKNDNAGIRWAASNALIGFKREAIPALLEALMHDFDSIGLRLSAHHILHVFKDDGHLREAEEKVFEALEGIAPAASVPWAASKALESLRHKQR
jgi:HEAT repeat protein